MNEPAKTSLFGAVTVGERGQIVIPADIRKAFNINSGDKLVVFAQADSIRLIRSEVFTGLLAQASEMMDQIQKQES